MSGFDDRASQVTTYQRWSQLKPMDAGQGIPYFVWAQGEEGRAHTFHVVDSATGYRAAPPYVDVDLRDREGVAREG